MKCIKQEYISFSGVRKINPSVSFPLNEVYFSDLHRQILILVLIISLLHFDEFLCVPFHLFLSVQERERCHVCHHSFNCCNKNTHTAVLTSSLTGVVELKVQRYTVNNCGKVSSQGPYTDVCSGRFKRNQGS